MVSERALRANKDGMKDNIVLITSLEKIVGICQEYINKEKNHDEINKTENYANT